MMNVDTDTAFENNLKQILFAFQKFFYNYGMILIEIALQILDFMFTFAYGNCEMLAVK